MRGDSHGLTDKRRSQRQRIDLSTGTEEGFDRHDLERALRASLDENKQKKKEYSPKRRKSNEKLDKNSGSSKKPPNSGGSNERNVGKSREDRCGEPEPKQKGLEKCAPSSSRIKKETTGESSKLLTVSKKRKLDDEVVPQKIEPNKDTINKKSTKKLKASAKSAQSSLRTSAAVANSRDPGLGRRVAATQASDFITLLACATKMLGEDEEEEDNRAL